MPSNYPPGVTGCEPQITGDYGPIRKPFKVESPGYRTRACSSLETARRVVAGMRKQHERLSNYPPFGLMKPFTATIKEGQNVVEEVKS